MECCLLVVTDIFSPRELTFDSGSGGKSASTNPNFDSSTQT